MKRYDSYKDSGVEWMNKIPSNWEKSRIRMVGDLYGGLTGKKGSDFNDEDNPSNKPFVPFTNIFNNTYISKDHFQYVNVEENENQNRVLKNDLFFLMSSESYEDLGKCSILLEDVEELYLNSFCKGFRIKNSKVYPLFLNYQLLGSLHKEMISVEGNGFTRINLRQDRLLDIPVFIPPLSEQQQIVSFLDTKTSLIDSLIEKTQRKIELLKEKRTSLINEVVTKGLNPNVEMKDSGVEWIGKIPKGWRIGKLYQYSEMSNGSTPSRVKPEYWENGTIPWMSSGEINKKKIRDIDGRITQEGFENSSTKILPIGTVMMGLNGQGKTKGTVGILEIETTCNQSLCGMIFKDDMYPMFSYYFLDSQYYHIRGLVGEGQREGISVSFLGRYPLVVPPISEQQQIVEYLDKQTGIIDKTISIEEKRIELLKEYRQSLISEVVTGKRKVV